MVLMLEASIFGLLHQQENRCKDGRTFSRNRELRYLLLKYKNNLILETLYNK